MKQYIVVDIETTGLSREYDAITEIAAVRYDGTQILSHFQSLVNPGKSIPPYITHLTGISNQMVASAPTIQEILPDFLAFLGSNIFVAHNAAFDHGFLAGSAEKHLQHTWTNAVLCTRKLANRVVPDLPRKGLGALCEHYGIINTQAHRAMADVLATTEVLGRFLSVFAQQQLGTSPEVALAIQQKTVGYGRKVFGKIQNLHI